MMDVQQEVEGLPRAIAEALYEDLKVRSKPGGDMAEDAFRFEMFARRIVAAEYGRPDAVDWAKSWYEQLIKPCIVNAMAAHGWHKDRIVDAFIKHFPSVVVSTQGSIWLRHEPEAQRWWLMDGNFTSAGENVLAGCFAIVTHQMSPAEIEQTIAKHVKEMERRIAGAFSVRLLRK
ncbi:MAG: hypothetical protein KGZ68_17540 [Dechloromonas sp.]|nr:hypothetical protein [Dechloromonas sp.]